MNPLETTNESNKLKHKVSILHIPSPKLIKRAVHFFPYKAATYSRNDKKKPKNTPENAKVVSARRQPRTAIEGEKKEKKITKDREGG